MQFLFILLAFTCLFAKIAPEEPRIEQNAILIRKHLKRLKKQEGGLKLVGGREEYEGNVEVLHNGQWGAVCDDEWDANEAQIVCKQLGYEKGKAKPTYSSHFGEAKRKFWMDNIYCNGTENELTDCRFDGWGHNDCHPSEAAGVICADVKKKSVKNESGRKKLVTTKMVKLPHLEVRIVGGRIRNEGRVEVKAPGRKWGSICGEGWSLLEAMVICKQLNLGYASAALQTTYFGGNLSEISFTGIKCKGNETSLSQCFYQIQSDASKCTEMAALSCSKKMADLIIDAKELETTAHLEDRQLFYLQCAMEENCLASDAYVLQREEPDNYQLERRRLLRFTAKIFNGGTEDFRPAIPKHLWEWHMCHRHYHSMEVFATFDIFDQTGKKVAEGHKASFCLEDNQCNPGTQARYACANYGDQGISVNCSDIYKYTVDCQWVDISELNPGLYTLKVAINPEFKVPEMSFDNNAAVCQFHYGVTQGVVTNCRIERP